MPAVMNIKRILCPVDFSDTSRRALEWAGQMAAWTGAALEVVHAMEDAPAMTAYAGLPDMGAPADPRASAQRDLNEWVAGLDEAVRSRSKIRVISGRSHKAILSYAAESRADLIVMGTHGRSGFEQAVMGSVTERVMRHAQCPVLVVPPPAEKDRPARKRLFKRRGSTGRA